MATKVKCVVVGDGSVGKTCLLWVYQKDSFPEEYVPTVFTNTVISNIDFQEKSISLALYDTAGQEEYDRLRPLSYPQTNVFLICFSVVNKGTYENVQYKWSPEIKHHCPYAQIVLVGTKFDLRDDKTISPDEKSSFEQGIELKEKIGAFSYVECSAKSKIGVKEIFQEVIKASLSQKQEHQKNKKCNLL